MAGESQRVARIMGGVMDDFQMREADKADDEQAHNGRHAERDDLRCGNADCTCSRIRNHFFVFLPSTRGLFRLPFVSGRSPGSRIERVLPAFPDDP